LCWLPELKVVAMAQVPCPRHTPRCSKSFCRVWKHFTTRRVPVTYSSSAVEIKFFRKGSFS
jgi:hypothetical protein